MQCPTCGSDNRVGAKFCNECATPLPLRCPSCEAENRPGAKFCDECATPLTRQPEVRSPESGVESRKSKNQKSESLELDSSDSRRRTPDPRPVSYTPRHLAERILAEQAALEARGVLDGERKTITALFADIKGSMDLIEGLDPEDARHVVDPALQLMMDAVHRYEGYVAQSTGDGIFALFGAPIAHEDHPQRALYAALHMQEESKRYAKTLQQEKGINLQIRVGLNTGEVVLRSIRKDDLHTDYTPIGHSTSLAARMESLATPGSVVVSEHTQRLVDGYFEFQPLGPTRVKGVSEPIHVYEVLGLGPLRSRLQQAARRGLAHFVGRQHELKYMQRVFDRAREGRGQVLAVIGEPGVGKSRLFHEFKLSAPHGCLVLETFAASHSKAYPYLPLIELLKNYFQLLPQDNEHQVREKVKEKVLQLDPRLLEDTLPYLFSLLGLAEPNGLLSQMDPQVRRRRLVDAVKRLLLRESLNQPTLCIFEDLQWLDSDTQTFLDALSDSVATAHMLLLVNYRPEYRHEWGNKPYYTQLRLAPLGQAEAKELLSALLEDGAGATQAAPRHSPLQALPAQSEEEIPYVPLPVDVTPFKQLVLEKTQGNPFFIEEIIQALFAQAVLVRDGGVSLTTVGEVQIPPTVQGVLASRIDRLAAEEKEFLQTLAVLGKEFPLSLAKRVVNKPEEDVQRLLSHVQAAEFIYEQPAFPESAYTFKHWLTQDVAYNSLLIERKTALHERTAQAIEELYRDRLGDYYRELAHHYGRSGNSEKAIEYLQHAGLQAAQRSAYTEAIGHLTAALALLKTQPDTLARAQQELTLQIALGPPLMMTRGWADPAAEQAYTRARALSQQVGETAQIFPVLRGLWVFYLARAELQTARELGTQILSLAQSVQEPALLIEAHYTVGSTAFWLGECTLAREHLEQAIALYDAQPSRVHTIAGLDFGVLSKCLAALTLWSLGYPDQALQKSQEALTLARDLSFPFSLAFAFFVVTMFHQSRRDKDMIQERAEAGVRLSIEHGFPFYVATGNILLGCLQAEQGQEEKGIAQILQGLTDYRATGAELIRPYFLSLLATAYDTHTRTEEGLAVLTEALSAVQQIGQYAYEPELYRLRGELLQSGLSCD